MDLPAGWGCFELRIHCYTSVHVTENRHVFIGPTDFDSWQATYAELWDENLAAIYVSGMGQNIRYHGIQVVDVFPGLLEDFVFERPVHLFGALPNPCAPPQCCPVITWTTDLAGRSYRGRTYLPGIDESLYDFATMTGYGDAWLQAYGQAMLDFYGPGADESHGQLVILSKVNAGAVRDEPVATPVTSFHYGSFIHTQRRRAEFPPPPE